MPEEGTFRKEQHYPLLTPLEIMESNNMVFDKQMNGNLDHKQVMAANQTIRAASEMRIKYPIRMAELLFKYKKQIPDHLLPDYTEQKKEEPKKETDSSNS